MHDFRSTFEANGKWHSTYAEITQVQYHHTVLTPGKVKFGWAATLQQCLVHTIHCCSGREYDISCKNLFCLFNVCLGRWLLCYLFIAITRT
ncbi:hypothetical protein M144_2141 [Bacteroides fragilis str. 3-F-2 |nr:hypothetical protein M144_2141 [Bacteroides fragilis str. 3-F-2 \